MAEVSRDGAEWELATSIGSSGRERSLQGKPATLAEQLALLPLVVWSEAEHELVRGGDAVRRRFLDRAQLLLEPATVSVEAEQARAWRQKRALLARGGAAGGNATPQLTTLTSWNELLAPHVVRKARTRAALCAELTRTANALLDAHASDLPRIEIDYRPSPAEALSGENELLAAFAEMEGAERERRQPLAGPQRDRIAVTLGARGSRRFASGGEQKIVALSLVAALGAMLKGRGREPLVLLDDVESELDRSRGALAEALFEGHPQVFATGSRADSAEPSRRAAWRLDDGRLSRR